MIRETEFGTRTDTAWRGRLFPMDVFAVRIQVFTPEN